MHIIFLSRGELPRNPGKGLYTMPFPTGLRAQKDRLGAYPVGKGISSRFIAISELGKLGHNRKSHNGEAQHGNTMGGTEALTRRRRKGG